MTRTTATTLVRVPPYGDRSRVARPIPQAELRFDWELRGRLGSWRAELFHADELVDDVESRSLTVLALRMIRARLRASDPFARPRP